MRTERAKPEGIGFGFVPEPRSGYHFEVTVPRGDSDIIVEEHFVYGEDVEDAAARVRMGKEELEGRPPIRDPQTKIELSRLKWERVAEDVRSEFNRRLRSDGFKAGAWKVGANCLAPYLGKELVLLLWAIEDADPSQIPNALSNWQGLAPEERWWLYTTINASYGHPSWGRDRGWRKAIRIAFTENPVTESSQTYFTNSAASMTPRKNGTQTSPRRRKNQNAEDENSQLPFLSFDVNDQP